MTRVRVQVIAVAAGAITWMVLLTAAVTVTAVWSVHNEHHAAVHLHRRYMEHYELGDKLDNIHRKLEVIDAKIPPAPAAPVFGAAP